MVEATGMALPKRLAPTSLTLSSGELTCVIGPNGSGKTSLLHALAGIGTPQGQVRIGGVDPRRLAPAGRAALLSYLPASREIAWPIPARDWITLGLPAHLAPGRGEALLAFFDLHHLADRRADRLSTGERSRLLIARALAADPRLILLDEPTANLDPLWQLRVLDHLQALARKEGRALLLAIHDLDLAGRYADRLLIIDQGQIVADGGPTELLAGSHIPRIFGIARNAQGWRPVRPAERPRSSR
jgi:iron complex transport system ATP-binding protein